MLGNLCGTIDSETSGRGNNTQQRGGNRQVYLQCGNPRPQTSSLRRFTRPQASLNHHHFGMRSVRMKGLLRISTTA
eukprot:3501740-Rhodomonas_salina.1